MKKYGEDKHYSEKRPYCRFDIINYLIEKNNYVNYLEIGVRVPRACFNRIIAKHKDGIDPKPLGSGEVNYPMTSDEFFSLIEERGNIKYDIILIDGLHLYKQVSRDIKNSLNHITDNGTIVVHDCNPISKDRQTENYIIGKSWNGTSWKAYAELRCLREDLSMAVVDTDEGVGIIQRGNQKLWIDKFMPVEQSATLDDRIFTYEYFDKNRKELLNLISVEEFERIYSNGRCIK